MKLKCLGMLGLICWGWAYADSAIYELPAIGTSAAPPFTYPVSPILGNQVVISESQISRFGANNLGQLLNHVSGVQYIPGVSAEPEILLHSEPALILVNGESLTNFSMSNPDINLIPLSEIQKIVISPTADGTLYGNQSLGGMINIITKSVNSPIQSVSVLVGTPLTNQIVGVSGGPIDQNNAYRVDAQNEFTDGYRDYSQTNLTRGAALFQHDYANGSMELNTNIMHQNQEFPGYLTDAQVSANPQQSVPGQGQGTYQANTGLIGLTWTQHLQGNWQLQTKLSDRGQDADSNLGGAFTQTYNTLMINPELSGDLAIANRSLASSIGISFSNETYSFDSPTLYYNINGANQQQYSTYGDLNVPISGGLSLNTSGRLVAIETQGQFFNDDTYQFNPESSQSQDLALLTVGLNEALNQEATLYLRRAMGYQLPFIDQSNFTANPNTGFGLQATASTSYEAGVNWQGSRFQGEAQAFLTNLDNEIGFFSPPNGIAANYNLPPTRREGLTTDGSYEPTANWTLGASVTLMNNYFRQGTYTGNTIPGSADTLADLNARYQITPVWSVYAEAEYTGHEYADGDNANVTTPIPGYWVENVALNAEFPAWLINLRLDDLTNTRYYLATIYDAYLTPPYNNPVAYYPAPGRTLILSLSYRFH